VHRKELERILWPEGDPPADALRGQVYLLRRALADAGYEGLETVHGFGFRLKA
jgi:DNA-binding winged helix-turn-helix (wHTH) protein